MNPDCLDCTALGEPCETCQAIPIQHDPVFVQRWTTPQTRKGDKQCPIR